MTRHMLPILIARGLSALSGQYCGQIAQHVSAPYI